MISIVLFCSFLFKLSATTFKLIIIYSNENCSDTDVLGGRPTGGDFRHHERQSAPGEHYMTNNELNVVSE